ncbi:N-acetyltransferase family protein [Actinomadura nitritigenes]|uniref:GNAT family N-acetyltransferase n=1 Tax=Actinomadura nitritigenes TaxID=134602 RepID=UPI003D8D434B
MSSTMRRATASPSSAVLAADQQDDARLWMLLEDLGEHPEEDASLHQGAVATVAIHACRPCRASHDNTASLRVHAKAGFRTVGTPEKIGRHPGNRRDVVLIERRSSPSAAERPPRSTTQPVLV